MDNAEILKTLIDTVHRLRAPGGCPWDREQTHQSLRPYLIEEAYEVLDVLDRIQSNQELQKPGIKNAFLEELGDLWMQVLLHSEMANEAGAFNIYDVAKGLNDKLIRRHPHVFGDVKVDSADAAYKNWEKEKAKEKAKKNTLDSESSVLDGVPKALPSLQKASRMIEKVSKVGFQWSDLKGPLDKIQEELDELKEAIKNGDSQQKISNELGDLLFTVCNVAHFLKISPEDALREMLDRFESRFRYIETKLRARGKTAEQSTLEEMDTLWKEAKKAEKKQEKPNS